MYFYTSCFSFTIDSLVNVEVGGFLGVVFAEGLSPSKSSFTCECVDF